MLKRLLPVVLAPPAKTTFELRLLSSLIPEKAVNPLPTFSRTTTASIEDFEKIIRYTKVGEARFGGARRVDNLLKSLGSVTATANSSDDISNCTAVNCTASYNGVETTLTVTVASSSYMRPYADSSGDAIIGGIGDTIAFSCMVKGVGSSIGKTISIGVSSLGDPSPERQVTLTSEYRRVVVLRSAKINSNQDYFYIGLNLSGSASLAVGEQLLVKNLQIERTTGQTNTNPSEYVSVGILASPYHGAGVDGVKYFEYENGNTVTAGVITEARGADIPDATLLGYLSEGQRTNLALRSQEFDNASWSKTDTTITADNTTAPDGTLTADLITEGSAGTAQIFQAFTVTANAIYATSFYIKRGNTDWVLIKVTDTGNAANYYIGWFNLATGAIGTVVNTGTATYAYVHIIQASNGFYKCILVGNLGAGVTSSTVAVWNCPADNNSARVSGATRYMWGAQYELGEVASTYIATTTASATRNADTLYYLQNNINLANHTLSCEVTTPTIKYNFSAPTNFNFMGFSSTYRPFYMNGGVTSSSIYCYDGTFSTPNNASFDTRIKNKLALSYKNNMSLIVNGTVVSTLADGIIVNSVMTVGCRDLASGWAYGYISNIKIYNKAKSISKTIKDM